MAKYKLTCSVCNWREIIDTSAFKNVAETGLSEVKRSPVQRKFAIMGEDGKISEDKFWNLTKMFKCKQCGRGVTPKKVK